MSLALALAAAVGASAEDLGPVLAPWAPPAMDEAAAAPYRKQLEDHVRQFLARQPYAPLLVVMGRSGVAQVFSQSSDAITALSRAYPYLPADLQAQVKGFVRKEIEDHPPYDPDACGYEVWQGRRRELYAPTQRLEPRAEPPLEIGGVYSVWLFAEKTGSHDFVGGLWEKIKPALSGKLPAKFAIDPVNGHWAMNRVVLGLIGYARLAERLGDKAGAAAARAKLGSALDQLRRYWSDRPVLPEKKYFAGVTPAAGEALVVYGSRVARPEAPQAFSLACLAHMQGEIARFLADAPMKANVLKLLHAIDHVGPTWFCTGAAPWILHTENAQDLPDEAPGILFAKAFVERVPFDELARYVDLPLCEGDFFYIERLVTVIERSGDPGRR